MGEIKKVLEGWTIREKDNEKLWRDVCTGDGKILIYETEVEATQAMKRLNITNSEVIKLSVAV